MASWSIGGPATGPCQDLWPWPERNGFARRGRGGSVIVETIQLSHADYTAPKSQARCGAGWVADNVRIFSGLRYRLILIKCGAT